MAELPVRAVIKSRFDLGFVLQHPDSRFGELRVPEMSRSTAEWDRSPDADAGIGNTVDVYVVRDTGDGYLFSEFSAEERTAREQRHQGWLAAQEQARVGSELFVRVERKLEWGCICRQETEPFLTGVIATLDTVVKNDLPRQCAVSHSEWERLEEGASVSASIAHKQSVQWGYILYFSVEPSLPTNHPI